MLTAGLDIRVPTEDGELLRHPKLDPTRDISHWAPFACARCPDTSVHNEHYVSRLKTSTTCRSGGLGKRWLTPRRKEWIDDDVA